MPDPSIVNVVGDLVGIPAGVAGIGIPLYLWLSGKVQLSADADKREIELKAQLTGKDVEIATLTAEKEAWKKAHEAEVEARQAASRAAAALLDSANISNSLLAALKEALGQRIGGK